MLLSGQSNDKVAKIEISTGIITPITPDDSNYDNISSYISLVFSDSEGELFMMSNDNGFYKVNTATGELAFISSHTYPK